MAYWREYGVDVLANLGITANLNLGAFMAATIASGDIAHSTPFNDLNIPMSAGRCYASVWLVPDTIRHLRFNYLTGIGS